MSDHPQRRDDRALQLLADTVPCLLWIARKDGFVEYWNEPMRAYLGVAAAQPSFAWSDIIHADDVTRVEERVREHLSGIIELELRLRRNDGMYRWFLARMAVLEDDGDRAGRWFGSGTDIHDRKRAADAMAFLEDATDELASARDVGTALRNATMMAVPRMADWCAIYLRKPDGIFYPAGIHHRDPERVRLAHELVRRYPFSDETSTEMLERRRPIFMPEITPAALAAGAKDATHAELLAQLDLASAIVVPLVAGDGVIGMLHLVRGAASERFVASDVDLAQIVARRVAIAIDNAALYERDHHVAETFQRAALPRTLPQVPFVELDAVYVAGEREAQIGGDWYDALTLADGSLVISIGDVAGKGLEAAVLMSSVRQAIRVAALQALPPDRILAVAQMSLTAERPGRFVTAFVGRFSAGRTELEYACAGHPAPLLHNGGAVYELELGGPPLGVTEFDYDLHRLHLAERCLLVAFTDGLIETTTDVIGGQRRVSEIVASAGIEQTARPATYVCARILGESVRDDTAILSVRIDRRAVAPRFRFRAEDAAMAGHARRRFVAWMNDYVEGDRAAAELIGGELIGNVVRHAPGAIDVAVDCEGGVVRMYVQDVGAPPEEFAPALRGVLAESGRGLLIVEKLGANMTCVPLPVFGKQISVELPVQVRPRLTEA